MTHSNFSKLLNRRIDLTKKTLDKKSKEYSTGEDKLYNFIRASEVERKHPAQCLQGMLLKHLVSYLDMIDQIANGKKFERSYLDEKFGDIINYFILQEAIFVEYGIIEDLVKVETDEQIRIFESLSDEEKIKMSESQKSGQYLSTIY